MGGLVRWVRESSRDEFFWLRVGGGSTAIALAVLVAATDGVHDSFLILLGIAAVAFAFPWHRLSALRAGPFEISLQHGQIEAAVSSIEIGGGEEKASIDIEEERETKERLRGVLSRLEADVKRARGSRVLWVDDSPLRVLAERRLLRALDVETIMVPFTREAAAILTRDNDFDLVITSFHKPTETALIQTELGQEAAERLREDKLGVLFVQWLRGGTGDDSVITSAYGKEVRDRSINELPILLYVAATGLPTLREAVARIEPGVEVSREVDEFFAKAIRMLADARSHPIVVPVGKRAPGA